jgi:predicted membrane GTPase involved in stress response
VTSNTRLPLRLLVTDPSERLQLGFAEQGKVLLAGVSGVQTQSSARGLIINGLAERDLSAAVAMLQAAIPTVVVGALDVVYLDQGAMEPWVRVRVTTPADHVGDVVSQLNERQGLIEALDDTGEAGKIVTASAPLVRMLGYDKVMAAMTGNRALVEYEFLDYRRVPTPPIPPRTRALQA